MKTYKIGTVRIRRAAVALSLLALFVWAAPILYGWETLDRVIAVVGDKVILESELDFQVQFFAAQAGVDLRNQRQVSEFRNELLDQMINDRLILVKAIEDTSIHIPDKEVEAALQKRIDELRRQFANEQQFEAQLESEGFNLRELRNKLRLDIRDQLYKDRLVNKMLSRVSVSRSEVEKFYNTYRDSLPDQPRSVKIAHLLLELSLSDQSREMLVAQAQALLERIRAGESFETLAQQYSQDVSAEVGGDIGTFRKGDLMPELEKAALALNAGDVSDVVKTDVGYHIVKLVGKTEDSFHTKHIVLLSRPTPADTQQVESLARALIDSVRQGADWGLIVKNYSADDDTRASLGELGWIAVSQLPPEFRDVATSLEPGELSEPIWSADGLHIVRLNERREEREITLKDDFDLLKEYARRQKSAQVIEEVVGEMRARVHVERRD